MKAIVFSVMLLLSAFHSHSQNNSIIIYVNAISSDKPIEKVIITRTPIDSSYIEAITNIKIGKHKQGYITYIYVLDSQTFDFVDSLFSDFCVNGNRRDDNMLGSTIIERYSRSKLTTRFQFGIPSQTKYYMKAVIDELSKNPKSAIIVPGIENLCCRIDLKYYPCK